MNSLTFIFHNSPNQKGFTVVELLIVISIMAVLSVVSIASFSTFNNSQQLNTAALNVKNMMQYAKSQALSQINTCTAGQTLVGYKLLACCQGGSCPVCLSNNSYEVDVVCSGGSTFVKGENFPNGVTFDTSNSTSYSFLFNTLSGTVTGTGNLILKQSNVTKKISVSSTGVIQ
ncbi:MAG TPA: prepilin-type N-terminal cleavage/methylation domain-containing protein [Candidatus Saccharimonadales bacterium]|nr:prepilin-type N-terminal cleavage/methylation domain-containing protein [Candidatus Saccharimonadales bacterium]